MESPTILKIWTDGSCYNNGQPNAKAGIGVFFGDQHEENIAKPFLKGKPTNQRAELYAIFCALETVFVNLESSKWWFVQQIIIYTDSAYSIGCLNEWIVNWKKKGWKNAKGKPVENLDIIQPIDKLINSLNLLEVKIHFQKVKGHSTDYGNCQADLLANLGTSLVQ